ncbi:glycosyl transferase [Rhizobium sp. CSW-27]|uniref:glycosyl transferase n=1 Tax=Rhizobium sp. CSW-27 TaxID=2839985 RepID=UPI001C00A5AE|nr:glycosyl transferase [Rhizobium sp. CSW-27]MBT9372700.1 glycosyl transferase [Rhizobium sp. CSW-27]
MSLHPLIVSCLAAATSALVVFLLIRKARQLGLVQAPEARSSHVRPTPTGGGVGIVAGTVLAGLLLPGGVATAPALLLCGTAMAAIGLIDDRTPLPARFRLPGQILIVALGIAATGGGTALAGNAGPAGLAVAALLLLLGGVWWVNLFNFMDGIDGIAGQQAVTMMASAMLIAALADPAAAASWLWWYMAGLAAAALGFLAFNFPPARIFMGDAGSTFLGFSIAAIAMASLAAGWLSLPQWLLLATLFAADATVTLGIRFLRRQRLTEAHRSHAYQRLSRRLGGARPVTLGAAALNVCVLMPLAALAGHGMLGWLIVIVVYAAAALGALCAGAGLSDDQPASLALYRRLLARPKTGGAP